jgi:hypothetical protein
MQQRGVEVDAGSYHFVLSAWERTRTPEAPHRSEHWLNEMLQLYQAGNDHFKPTTATFRSVLSTWAYCGVEEGPSKVYELVNLMVQLGILTENDCLGYNFALEGYARAGRGEEAENLLRSLVEGGQVELDLTSFHHVIKAWTLSSAPDGVERAEAVFLWMQELNQKVGVMNCQPNSVTYSTMMQVWSRSSDPRAVSKVGALIKEMMAASLTPNESVYASLIMSIAKSNLPNKRRRAKTVLHDMKKRGIEPNPFTQELIASIKEEA